MPRFSTIALACLALAGGGVIAGCGDDEKNDAGAPAAAPAPAETETTPAPSAGSGGEAVEVGIKDIKFVPDTITAKVGQKVVWTNNEAVTHNVTATEGAKFKSENLNQDDTYEYTATAAGTIDYVCTIHSGQNGQITVTK